MPPITPWLIVFAVLAAVGYGVFLSVIWREERKWNSAAQSPEQWSQTSSDD